MTETTIPNLNWIANYIWGIADDVLRDVYVRGKYRDVILPMTVLRRLDAVLEPTKQAVLDMKTWLDEQGIVEQKETLRQAAGQAFYNTSKFTLHDLRARASRQQLKADFEDYLDGFSPNVQDILENFEFRNLIPKLSKADALGTLIEKLTSPDVNLGPAPVMETDGTIRHPGLDNHGMGTVFEELIRRFNEEAGEQFTPRHAVKLMANLVFLPIADQIESGTYLLYDGACGTGGMLTVGEAALLKQLHAVYSGAPSTTVRAYTEAQEALQQWEEMTFSDEEIDKLLPRQLQSALWRPDGGDQGPSAPFQMESRRYGRIVWRADWAEARARDAEQSDALRGRG